MEVLSAVCDRVIVAAPAGHVRPGWVEGGASRSASVRNALEAAPEARTVVVHDAARPLVTTELVEACLAALMGVDGAIAAAPVTDTVKEAYPDGTVLRTLDRSRLWAVQTPQVFRAESLRRALNSGRRDPGRRHRRRLARGGGRGLGAARGSAAGEHQGHHRERPRARGDGAVLTDYHVHLRPDDDDSPAAALLHRRQCRALPRGGRRARDRGAGSVRAHPPLRAVARRLDAPVVPALGRRRRGRVRRLPARRPA